MSKWLVLLSVVAVVAAGCDEKKKQKGQGAPAEEAKVSADEGSKPGPKGAEVVEILSEASIKAHLNRLMGEIGCESRPEDPFCGAPAKFTEARRAELPTEPVVWLGLSRFVATEEGAEGASEPSPVALGIVNDGAQGARAEMTRLIARREENRDKIRGLARQVRELVSGEAKDDEVVIHDPRLMGFIKATAQRATVSLEPGERGWTLKAEAVTKLRKVGERWVSVHQGSPRPDRPDGLWVTIYTPAELVGEVTPTVELDEEAVTKQLGCGEGAAAHVARSCEVWGRFRGAGAPGEGLEEGARELWIGRVQGPDGAEDVSAGAVHLRLKGGELQVAFSEVGAQGEDEEEALDAVLSAVEAGERPPADNAAMKYIEQAGQREEFWGPVTKSDGVSGLVARPRLFRAHPDARTITYFRRAEGGELVVVTRDTLGGKSWFWSLREVPAQK